MSGSPVAELTQTPDSPERTDRLRSQVAATLLPGFVGTTLPEWLDERLRDGLGGVCIFGPNIVSRAQLRELTDSIYEANPNAIIAIDEEGGDVTRLYYDTGSPYPGNAVLGRLGDLSYTEFVGRLVGWELRLAGCNLNFAPDVDINSNADNPVIGVRSFGSTPEIVAEHSAAWTRGLQSAGIAVSAKHFPGHGDTAQDSHLALPVVDVSLDELRERELKPFAAVIAAGARTIMTSHILLPQIDPENPATLSAAVLQGLLRDELGFDGVIISDALDMKGASGDVGIPEAAVLALAAGCDLLCIGTENTDAQLAAIETRILDAISSRRLDPARVSQASGRVLELAAQLAVDRAEIAIPDFVTAEDEPQLELARAIAAFDVSDAAREWVGGLSGPCSVVRIDTIANIAVGIAPWGPFAELLTDPGSPAAKEFAANPLVVFTEGDDPDLVLAARSPVLVIGKDNHRHAFAREAIDRLRAERRSVLVIDMGWPSDDRQYADIATFGASRLIGRALMHYLSGSGS
ncbi:beta-N-acetylhexosaminidase [Diaminobutyricibacter sp. McL0608]|uniref:beta-N-acetylhexosaminidase n=1 Tax=Leifsonia sp. McL0608 TaxID=3143537 RepID=UPI0031F316FB